MLKKTLEGAGPGTGQVNLGGVVTMFITIASWGLAEYVSFEPPGSVWAATTGIVVYGLQYWHGPGNKGV